MKKSLVYLKGLSRNLLTIFVLLLLTSSSSFGTQILREDAPPALEQINRDMGLSNMSVSSIIQDKYGFLWFGTQGGLNRYDGRTMMVIRNNPFNHEGLVHNLIQTMTYDPINHELWIGTYQGISRYNIENNEFINYTVEDDGLANSVVVAITFDDDGYVWAGTLNGLSRLNPVTGEIKNYGISGDVVRALYQASDKKLYIGTYEGLMVYDKVKDQIIKMELDLPAQAVMVIREDEIGTLTLGIWDGGLIELNLENLEMSQISLEDNRIYTITKTSDQTKWVGTWGGGLFSIETNGKVTHFAGNSQRGDVHHPVVYSLFQDDSEILWVGTNGGGITKINPLKRDFLYAFNDKDDEKSLSAGKNNLIYRDSKKRLWIAIYNQGIERLDENTMTTIKYKPNETMNLGSNVITILEGPGIPILIGSSLGLSAYNEALDTFEPYPIGLPKESLVYDMALENDEVLWVGTYREGLFSYNLRTSVLEQYAYKEGDVSQLSDNLVYCIFLDSKNRLWVGTNNGLNLREADSKVFKAFKKTSGDKNQLPNNTIREVIEDSQGVIWIATGGGGLSKFNEITHTFSTVTEEEGLSNNMVLGLLETDDDELWLSTLDGLTIINLVDESIKSLSPEDGIGGYEFNSGHFKDSDGTLFFGGPHGITKIPKSYIGGIAHAPRLYIDQVKVYGQPIPRISGFFNNQHLEFDSNMNFISIGFVALEYDAPDLLSYHYRLIGRGQDWKDAGSHNEISYSYLGPGQYTFEVYALTARGVATDVVQFSFDISKPWYLTISAFFVYIVLIGGLIYMLMKLRERKMIVLKNAELNSINIQLEEANTKLESLAIKDPLTGAYNRRYFDNVLEQQLQLAKRGKLPIGLMMFDIDDFKYINDNFGHVFGDQVLVQIVESIQTILQRSTDFISRFGGDEYIIGLYDTDYEGVREIARRIHTCIGELSFDVVDRNEPLQITVSAGIYCEIPNQVRQTAELVELVDKALYKAKTNGKNQISEL